MLEIILIFLIILLTMIIIIQRLNNRNLNIRIDNIEDDIIHSLLNALVAYENILTIDSKGYFRSEDEVGNTFATIKRIIEEYLITFNDLDINIDNVDFIQEKLINIKYLEKEITLLEKEERLYEIQMRARKITSSKSNLKI